ncbi:hypothetical protein ABPG74_019312 [Tetrahymena malaccensis]
MRNKQFIIHLSLLFLFAGIVHSYKTIELYADPLYYSSYAFKTRAVLGGQDSSSKMQCHQDFVINMGPYGGSDTLKDVNSLKQCGDVTVKGKQDYVQTLKFGSFNAPIEYYSGYSLGSPDLDFTSSKFSIPAQLTNEGYLSNPVFYLNYVRDFDYRENAQTKSYISLQDYDKSVLKPGASFIKIAKDPYHSLWDFPLKSVKILGQTYPVMSSYEIYYLQSYDKLGIGSAFQPFLDTLDRLGVKYQRDKDLFYYFLLNKEDIQKLPDIILQVTDADGQNQDLVIPPQNYIFDCEGKTILKVDMTEIGGSPLYFTYLTGFNYKDNLILLGERNNSTSQKSFLAKQSSQ